MCLVYLNMCVYLLSVSRICCFSRESQRKEIPELHSGNQAVKDLPLKMELYVSHFHGLFTLAQLLWHKKKKEAFSFTHTNNQANCPYLKMVEHVYLSSLPSESLPCT